MKKTKFFLLTLIIIMICCSCLSFTACKKQPPASNNNTIFDLQQNSINMQVSATASEIKIALSTNDSNLSGKVDILYTKAYEYLSGDAYKGVSANAITDYSAKKIGEYKLGQNSTITISRYQDNYDRLYDKFYAVQGDKIIKGPIYATDIVPKNDVTPNFDIKSKKGILAEGIDEYKVLNCSYTAINLPIDDFIYPNEKYENGQTIPVGHPADAVAFESNGKTFYFNKERIATFDNMIKTYYAEKAHITAILVARNVKGGGNPVTPETFPQNMTYLPWSTQETMLLSINTSNQSGFEYYVAMMEFMASRYSDSTFANGYIANYVIGNEIDYSYDYFRIAENTQSLDIYMEEYSRLLRLSNLAVKKYNKNAIVSMPLTQAWAEKGEDIEHVYKPKDMLEWLNSKTKLEGDYDWGIAPHSYAYGLASTLVFQQDTTNGREVGMTNNIETTSKITFSNIELLGDFLGQDNMKFNGKTRTVWLTESGVSSFDDSPNFQSAQAAAIAAIWYKLSQLDFVNAFIYYRMYDHGDETSGIKFGLLDINRNPKPAYEVYKYIDTQYSEQYANPHIQWIIYTDSTGKMHNKFKSYIDALDVFETNWLEKVGGFSWEKATPVEITAIPNH